MKYFYATSVIFHNSELSDRQGKHIHPYISDEEIQFPAVSDHLKVKSDHVTILLKMIQ